MYSCTAGLYRRRGVAKPHVLTASRPPTPPPPVSFLHNGSSYGRLTRVSAPLGLPRDLLPLPAPLSPTLKLINVIIFFSPVHPCPWRLIITDFEYFYAVCFPSSSVCHSVSVNTVSAIATLPGSRQPTTFLLHPDSSLVLGYPSLLFLSSSSLRHKREPQPCPNHHHHCGASQVASVS